MVSLPARNIELFDRITAYTLIELYENFPIPQNLNPEKIGLKVAEDSTNGDEVFQIITAYSTSTISFFADEKFIQYDKASNPFHGYPQYFNARLTLKGLTFLGAIPKTIDEKTNNTHHQPFIELLRKSFLEGTKSAISDAVKSLLTYAASSFISNN